MLGALGKRLQVLHRNLVVGSTALEPLRNHDVLGQREVLGRLAGELGHLLHLHHLRQLLREEALVGEEGDGRVTGGGLGAEHLVEDLGEGLSGGRHDFVGVCVLLAVAGTPSYEPHS